MKWTDPKWFEFYERCQHAIKTFDILVVRVHDIYSNRILHVLLSMQEVTLQTLPPEDEMWNVEEFLEKNEEACRQAAIELNRKSKMVEEAVEEVLHLVQNATQTFKKMGGLEEDPLGGEAESAKSASATAAKDANAAAGDNPTSPSQQQDWSVLWSCFENPVSLLASQSGGLPKGMQDMVYNAVTEMRRYYSRKVIDVLIKVTRAGLDALRRKFQTDMGMYIIFDRI